MIPTGHLQRVIPLGLDSSGNYTEAAAQSPAQRQYGAPTDSLVTSNGDAGTIASGGMAFIQNLDDAAVYVKLGSGASASVFSFVLSAGSAANDGLGGSKDITNYAGLVTVFAATGAPRLIFSNFA